MQRLCRVLLNRSFSVNQPLGDRPCWKARFVGAHETEDGPLLFGASKNSKSKRTAELSFEIVSPKRDVGNWVACVSCRKSVG